MAVLKSLALLVVITFVPTLELRASLPVGFFSSIRENLPLWAIVLSCLLANVGVGMITFWLMGPVEAILRRWRWFDRRLWPLVTGARDRLRPYVDKYGEWGLAAFIGIPLPGTGAYAGAFGAYLLGFRRRRFLVANAVGVLVAGVLVTMFCLLIEHGVVSSASPLRRLMLKE